MVRCNLFFIIRQALKEIQRPIHDPKEKAGDLSRYMWKCQWHLTCTSES